MTNWQCNIFDSQNRLIGWGGGMSKKYAAKAAADSAIRFLHRRYYERDSWAFQGL
ncbi:hypothetical protein K443DRAFT_678954 [Laccaria amethystina LaAM-08-1]|uniref:DRBM domain-containing protein n=1 Tax=Laccaria amethystina LaAM-08-1 TaxID=1095629 RepID=A0A0C9WQU6_9AGAR|nr:hypothetical protein K443DRAFT_678954 [Laccaria amethystina LaAM-08-1]